MELKTLACILAVSLFSHLSLSLEVEEVPPLTSEVWLEPVTSAHAQGRILGNSSALTVGAGALAVGSGLSWRYNKYKNTSPGSTYSSRPSYYSGPSYSTGYPSYSSGYPTYSSGYPSSNTVYRPSYSRPSYTSRPVYRPAVVRPTTYRPVVHQPSPPSSVPAPVPQPLYQFNGTHYVLANGPQSRKLSNYLTGTAGLLGGAYLYNKYQEYKNRPSYFNNQHYPSSHYNSGYKYQPSQPHYGRYPGSYVSQPSGEYQGFKRPGYTYVG